VPAPRGLSEAQVRTDETSSPGKAVNAGPAGAKPAAAAASADPTVRPRGVPEVVEVRQIVVQHEKSWKKAEQVKRNKEEARKRCEEALAMLDKGAAWDKVMEEYSDNPETKRNHGSMGLLTWEHTSLMIREPVFRLKLHERSPVTESPFGYHVYQRIQ